ncbi:hypothetical protein NYA30BAC_04127 [Halomonas sp. NYA30]
MGDEGGRTLNALLAATDAERPEAEIHDALGWPATAF